MATSSTSFDVFFERTEAAVFHMIAGKFREGGHKTTPHKQGWRIRVREIDRAVLDRQLDRFINDLSARTGTRLRVKRVDLVEEDEGEDAESADASDVAAVRRRMSQMEEAYKDQLASKERTIERARTEISGLLSERTRIQDSYRQLQSTRAELDGSQNVPDFLKEVSQAAGSSVSKLTTDVASAAQAAVSSASTAAHGLPAISAEAQVPAVMQALRAGTADGRAILEEATRTLGVPVKSLKDGLQIIAAMLASTQSANEEEDLESSIRTVELFEAGQLHRSVEPIVRQIDIKSIRARLAELRRARQDASALKSLQLKIREAQIVQEASSRVADILRAWAAENVVTLMLTLGKDGAAMYVEARLACPQSGQLLGTDLHEVLDASTARIGSGWTDVISDTSVLVKRKLVASGKVGDAMSEAAALSDDWQAFWSSVSLSAFSVSTRVIIAVELSTPVGSPRGIMASPTPPPFTNVVAPGPSLTSGVRRGPPESSKVPS